MQEQFEDLIIDNSGKKDKQKALLFKVILFIVIVLIVALAFKLMNSQTTPKTSEEPRAELMAQSNFEDISAPVQEVPDDEFDRKIESISEETTAAVNVPAPLIKTLPAPGAMAQNPAPNTSAAAANKPAAPAPVPAPKPAPAAPAPKPAVAPTPVPAAPAPKPAAVAKPAPAIKAPALPAEHSVFDELAVHDLTAKPAPKPAAKPAAKAPAPSASGTYIQVYAGKKIDPKSHELKNLTNLGLKYKIISSGGIERVIVGPYSAAEKADALAFVRAKVRKDAFFYHAK